MYAGVLLAFLAQVSATGSVSATASVAASPSPRPARPVKPVRTTFEKVRGRAHPAGARIELNAVVLSRTVIQAQSGAATKYYGLAVAPDGPYFAEVARAIEELRTALPAALKEAEAALGDDNGFRTHLGAADVVLKRVNGLSPAPAQALAVELQRFAGAATGYKWETVIDEPGRRPFPLVSPIVLPSLSAPRLNSTFTVEATLARVREMAAARPPALDQPLPEYRGVTLFETRKELEAHNRMIREYNAELARRRRYLLQLTAEDALIAEAELERLLAFREHLLAATVTASQALPSRTFAKIHGAAPGVWLRETSPKGQAVVDRFFSNASVLVTSFPRGASVSLAGQPAAPAPYLTKDVAVGTALALEAALPGHVPGRAAATVKASPGGVMRVEVPLVPDPQAPAAAATAAAPPRAGPWSVRGERGTVIVSQEAPIDWTNGGGKTGRPELILRCSAGEKEAYLFYEHGFGAAEGDLFARFDTEPKPKKFWGAPSQNGQSLFFSGFWSKGVDGFVKALLQHKRMRLTVKPKKKDPLPELDFDLEGLEPALKTWLEGCPLKK